MKSQNGFPVYIVDDDEGVRRSLAFMLASAGVASQSFTGGRDFLDEVDALAPGPVLLDLRMADIDGTEVLTELRRRNIGWPVVVITAHGEIAAAVSSIKLGAIDFIEKPFEEELLQACLRQARRLLMQPFAPSAAAA